LPPVVYFGCGDNNLYALNATTGEVFGAAEWKGDGTVEFFGSALTYNLYPKPFTNAITLNGPFTSFFNMSFKGVTFNSPSGIFGMNNGITTITDPSPNSIVGANATNYFTDGTLKKGSKNE